MSTEIKHIISELLSSSSQFNSNDLLVAVDRNDQKIWFRPDFKVDIDDFPKKILRDAQTNFKETGINSLCRMSGTIRLDSNNLELVTPLFLQPVTFKLDKVRNEITFTADENEEFLNPFVFNQLKKLEVPLLITESNELSREKWVDHLIAQGFVIETDLVGIGNFHHHRYEIVKELEELLQTEEYSSGLKQILLGEKGQRELKFSKQLLFSADRDHHAVFARFASENTIVQGPPGTGKSQLLTNILAKSIEQNYFTLVVSEKYAALEVIVKKLGEFELDKLCCIATSGRSSKNFIADLEKSWKYFESLEIQKTRPIYLAENFLDNLQITLDLLNKEQLIGGVNFHEFHSNAPDLSDKIVYLSSVPNIPSFRKSIETIESTYQANLSDSLSKFDYAYFVSDDFKGIDEKLIEITKQLDALRPYFALNTWMDIEHAMKTAADIQIFENEIFKKHREVLRPNSKEQKKFLRLYKSFQKLNTQRTEAGTSHWKKIPSELELENLKLLLRSEGYLAKRKFKRKWHQYSELSIDLAEKAINQFQQSIELKQKISQIEIKFCDLGIENPKIEAKIISQFIPLFSEEKWIQFDSLPNTERNKITASHTKIEQLHSTIKRIFKLNATDQVVEIIQKIQGDLPKIITHYPALKKLERSSFSLIAYASNMEAYSKLVYGHHWVQFKQQFPQFSQFKPSDLRDKIEKVIVQEKEDSVLFAKSLLQKVAINFKRASDLLSTPSSKLSIEEKERKKALRKGKSLLIKEFSKTRQHPSLRELFNSEARFWISILQPIWLSNPAELSHCFPMNESLFDVVIFDEASQIPLQNSLGALQRSKSVLVAGDQQQMGPTSYFKSGNKEIISLLHQASFYFTNENLSHHYRSEHPELIEFSNQHFYQNRLTAFPSASKELVPLVHHFIKDATYENRQNQLEAANVALEIEKLIHLNEHIGIVAFSQEQLDGIWDKISNQTRELLLTKIESNEAFFKPLEKVQGDECDRLIISFGFGKNSAGEFHYRFGPMNQAQGRNRLNVLLTRAKKQIHFFCSVQSFDFKLSTNESVELIRKWLIFSEKNIQNDAISFPYNLHPAIQGNQLVFNQVQHNLSEAKELVNLHRILSSRGWKCSYN